MVANITHEVLFQEESAAPIESSQNQPSAVLTVEKLALNLAGKKILQQIDFSLPAIGVTSVIGPSGAGKSSLLRCLNGLESEWSGVVKIDGNDIRQWPGGWDQLRRHVGLIAQKPVVFNTSIRANVCFGLHGWRQRRHADELVKASLQQAALWGEVRDRLDAPATTLSVGQQQRLCIARAIAIKPEILLLDEPTASLDPRSKQLVEQSMLQLAQEIPLICVTHDLEQAQRLKGQVIFMCDGRVIEQAASHSFFNQPQQIETREFLRWNVCDCD
ncbi:Phosphate transport ATP-binding protein PstB (TC 3.A.1.7.1) [hydrothermal vent metagenome]|uniref:Phosphate transport ATP-binding protein PstB (TC 3.A.1.7.1) n=1 Tax=hydrothermal vent metagenome TaxID=652676 RepID=A0A3B0ZP48_9ZZZZ